MNPFLANSMVKRLVIFSSSLSYSNTTGQLQEGLMMTTAGFHLSWKCLQFHSHDREKELRPYENLPLDH